MSQFTMTLFDGEDNPIEVSVDYDATYDPGCVSGPPEHCYPPDGEMTINSVTTEDGGDFKPTPSQEETIEEKAWEDYHNSEPDFQED